MQYNKHNLSKVNDKKLMRKVKRQWVVLSVAAFASLGASAFEMFNPNIQVHADDTNTYKIDPNSHSSQEVIPSPNSSVGRSTNNSQNGKSDTQTNAQQLGAQLDVQQPSESDKAQSNWNNGNKDTQDNNSKYQTTYANSTQGFKDSMNNDQQNIVKSQNNNQPTNPNVGNNNAGYKNGVQQYDQYRNAMNAGAADAYNGNNANPATQTSSQAKNYYNAAYNGSNDAKNAYNNATKNEGTNTNSYTSYNQWLTANNKDQTDKPTNNQSNVKGYQKSIDGNLNNSNNSSVQTNNGNVQVTNNSDSNLSVNQKNYQTKNSYADDSAYTLAYQYGYNYFLANQGSADAKSGKWNGTSGSNIAQSFYQPSGSNNPYDQAYLGAQAAINAQISQTQNGNNIAISNYNGSGNSAVYQSAYNDVSKDTQSGIVYLGNATQMNNVLQNNMSNVTALKLVNDIGYTGSGTSYSNYFPSINNSSLDIDGQNHILDMLDNNYNFYPNSANTKIVIHNFKTLYGTNYWGPFAIQSTANDNNISTSSLTYNNVNYVGSKLVSSYYSDVYINGKVNVDAVDSYNSPFNNSSVTISQYDSPNNFGQFNYQENMQIHSLILGANSDYFGNASSTGGSVIQLQGDDGSLTIGKNANMTLVPSGKTQGQNSPDNQNNYGITMKGSNSLLNINDGASLNILPDNSGGNKVAGIYNSGKIIVNGGTLNAEIVGTFANNSNQMIYSNGEINVTNGGIINVKVSGLGNANSDGLINNKNNINISNRGNLTVEDLDNGGGNVNLVGGNSVNVYNVGNQGVTFITNGSAKSNFATGGINAYTVTVYTDPNKKNLNWYYNFNLNTQGQANYVDSIGKSSSNNINSNQLYIRSVPSVSFVGPVYTTNDNGVTTIHGYAKIDNYSSSAGQLYVQYSSGNSGTYSSLIPFGGQNTKNQYSKIDTNNYYYGQNVDGTNLIPLSFTVPKSSNNSSNYGIRLRYGVSGVNAVVTNNSGKQSYTANTEGYTSNQSKQLVENDVKSASGNINSSSDGSSDGINDASSNTDNAKDPTKYQKDLDYTNAYDNAKAGYQAYLNNPNKSTVPTNSSDPSGYSQGYNKAASDAQNGYDTAIKGNDVNGQPDPNGTVAQKAGFTKGISVLQGVRDAQNNPNQGNGYQGNPNQTKAYQAASAGYANGGTGKMTDTQKQDPIYNQVFTNAQNAAQKAASNGSNQYVNGNPDQSNEGTLAEQTAHDYGYKQAQAGYQAQQTGGNISNSDPSYNAGVQMGQAVTKGENDANAASNMNPNYEGTAAQKTAYQATFAANQAAMNGKPQPDDLNQQPQVYQDAYKKAYADTKQKIDAINQAIANGNNNPDTSNLNPAQQTIYNQAKQSIQQATNDAAKKRFKS